jgi:hypothetical protein
VVPACCSGLTPLRVRALHQRRPAAQAGSSLTGDLLDANLNPELAQLPGRLHSLSLTEPSVARNILEQVAGSHAYMCSEDIHSLRGSSQMLRDAVNRTVSSVQIELFGAHDEDVSGGRGPSPLELTSDLGATFPNAVKLSASLTLASSPMELAQSLTGLPRLCPTLLARLQDVTLDLPADHLETDMCISSLNGLLSKYVSQLFDAGWAVRGYGMRAAPMHSPQLQVRTASQCAAFR